MALSSALNFTQMLSSAVSPTAEVVIPQLQSVLKLLISSYCYGFIIFGAEAICLWWWFCHVSFSTKALFIESQVSIVNENSYGLRRACAELI